MIALSVSSVRLAGSIAFQPSSHLPKTKRREHPEELAYRCYLSVLAGFRKYLPFAALTHYTPKSRLRNSCIYE